MSQVILGDDSIPFTKQGLLMIKTILKSKMAELRNNDWTQRLYNNSGQINCPLTGWLKAA